MQGYTPLIEAVNEVLEVTQGSAEAVYARYNERIALPQVVQCPQTVKIRMKCWYTLGGVVEKCGEGLDGLIWAV